MSEKGEKSTGLRREWRVVYRIGSSQLFSIDVPAFTAAKARAEIEREDVLVWSVSEIRPLMDPHKTWLTMEEAAERVGKSVRTVARWIETGLLAKCDGGNPIWTAHAIDQAAARSVGLKFDGQGDLKAA